ncbi:MAG: hypothetical protein DRP45_01165 [Candidatus Zixiibacteriota bacterium]|nr:MAG: hypothetical protein DRP45_01165 [candidate division Zixibacteria bacterium]
MKKQVIIVGVLVMMAVSFAGAQTPKFGVGFSGGINIPIIQDDQKSGSIFEFRARFSALPFLTIEPKLSFSSYGSPDTFEDIIWDVDGSKITAYGVDGILGGALSGPGFAPFFVAGMGWYKISNDSYETIQDSETKFGFSGGMGFAIGITPKFSIDARAKAHFISWDGGAKKSLALLGGLNYAFGGGI